MWVGVSHSDTLKCYKREQDPVPVFFMFSQPIRLKNMHWFLLLIPSIFTSGVVFYTGRVSVTMSPPTYLMPEQYCQVLTRCIPSWGTKQVIAPRFFWDHESGFRVQFRSQLSRAHLGWAAISSRDAGPTLCNALELAWTWISVQMFLASCMPWKMLVFLEERRVCAWVYLCFMGP